MIVAANWRLPEISCGGHQTRRYALLEWRAQPNQMKFLPVK
jgi:hypothetical protein